MPPPSDDEIRRRYGLPPGTRVVRLRPDALGRVRVDPDAFAYVEVDSSLEWAVWERPAVVAGGAVWLTAQGAFVGEGAPLVVTLKDARNRTVGRGRARVHRDRAVVEVEVDRRAAERDPDGVLCAADVEIADLGLTVVSAPLLVLPFAELRDARWGAAEARDGDVVELSCRLSGSAAGVERAGREAAEVVVLRGDEGAAGGLASAFEPVATLRAPVVDGRVSVQWRVGYGPEGKAQITTQAELDAVAERSGGAAERYRRPAWRFRVRLAGLEAESAEMGYRDHVDLAWGAGTDWPAGGAAVEVRLADGSTREETLGDDGRLRLDDVPPGPVEALFGPDPRVWELPELGAELSATDPLPDPPPFDLSPEPAVLFASVGFDPALLAESVGFGLGDDDEGWIEWLWGTLIGDFNEDAGYDQIIANIGASFIPGVGQVMDVRDVVAALYLLAKDRGWEDPFKWLGLFATLVGIVPFFGDVLKGMFRIALRSMRRGADEAVGLAAEALEAAFAKAKRVMEEFDLDHLDRFDSAAHLVQSIRIDQLVSTARTGVAGVTGRVSYLFTWFAGVVESPFFRGSTWAIEWLIGALSRARAFAGQAFRLDASRVPAIPENTARLGTMLRNVARRIEALQMEANERIGRGLTELYDKLREIVGLPPRPRGTGVTGRVVRPQRALRDGEEVGVRELRSPRPNSRYEVNGYTYETDELGRVKKVEGQLVLETAPRNNYQQGKVGRSGIRQPDGSYDRTLSDDGGHLVGSRFLGSGEPINMVPMNAEINQRGAWRRMEDEWAEALREGREVRVEITPRYTTPGGRPDRFDVVQWINGRRQTLSIRNTPGG